MTPQTTHRAARVTLLAVAFATVPAQLHAQTEPKLTWGETAYCVGKAALVGAVAGSFQAGLTLSLCLDEEAND